MNPERWRKIDRIYNDALEQPAELRASFLATECGGDDALRREIESLLAHGQKANPFLERPAVEVAAKAIGFPQRESLAGRELNDYKIGSFIGAGGMAEVYSARDTKLNRKVAIKVLPHEFAQDHKRVARFKREARLLASLNHPRIAAIYGFEEDDGIYGIALEFVDGETLEERIAKRRLTVSEALDIARQIAEALEASHAKGIVHRDLKPSNVKITADGSVKVLDFGLAKIFSGDGAQVDPAGKAISSDSNIILGTVAYMSPEQASGKDVDKRTDIWAWGCVLYEMLTGVRVFDGETTTDVIAKIATAHPDWVRLPESTPPAIRNLLRLALHKDPNRRLHDIADARIEIENATDEPDANTSSVVNSRHEVTHSTVMRILPWAVALVAVALSAVVLVRSYWFNASPDPPSTRFEIGEPAGAKFPTDGPVMPLPAISPDGRHIVFVARSDPKRAYSLWVHSLESGDARPLPQTESALLPFWSPDSKYIGFFAQRQLQKIALAGGPPERLCDLPSFNGGTWNRDGVILVAAATPHGILQIPPDGGQPVEVTTVDLSRQQRHTAPFFLPDGRRFLYTSRPDSTVYLGSLDAESPRKLTDANSKAEYSDGHLFFIREASLMAQKFDPASGSAHGDAFLVAEGVGVNTDTARGAFSVSSTGTLVYRTSYTTDSLHLSLFDRRGRLLSIIGPPADYQSLDLSPDGRRAVVERHEATEAITRADLVLVDLAGATIQQFTSNPDRHNSNPVWSPDGSQIVFSTLQPGYRGIHIKSSGGGDASEELLRTESEPNSTGWSRDGLLIYSLFGPALRDLWLLPMAKGSQPRLYWQTEFGDYSGQFSPDGKWIAYVSSETGAPEVYVQSLISRRIIPISNGGGNQPRWCCDGKELFFLTPGKTLMVVAVKSPSTSFEAAVPKELFQSRVGRATAPFFTYDVTADGQRFFMAASPIDGTSDEKVQPLTVVLHFAGAFRK